MLQKLRERTGNESGFTLVELLVVMLIIGILAAIAIPSFFNQRDKARDVDSKADARSAQTALETYATDNNGLYTGADNAKLIAIEPTLSDATARLTLTIAADSYTIRMASVNTPNTFSITRAASGATTLPCTVAASDGCPSDGFWD